MTAIAGFRLHIDCMAEFRTIGRIADAPIAVENAHPNHAGFRANSGDQLMQPGAIVTQHVGRGAALDDIAYPLSAEKCRGFQMTPMEAHGEEAEKGKNSNCRKKQEGD